MTFDLLPALIGFAFATSITPGPNNLMLMASGANFGTRRTLPHMFGVGIGFTAMIAAIGLGLAALFDLWPPAHLVLKAVSALYLLWLAWKIATARPRASDAPDTGSRPMTFLAAAAFQWVNPKAWAMALTAIAAYAPDHSIASVLAVALVFGLVNIPSIGCWTILGEQMRRILTSPPRLRTFNILMALLLVATLWPMLHMV